MASRDVDAKVKTNKYAKQVAEFAGILAEIEEDLVIYNKLDESMKSRWTAKDPLLSAFIALAAKVK